LRWFIRERLGGKAFLRFAFWLEERAPHFFGVNGQYPMIIFEKEENRE